MNIFSILLLAFIAVPVIEIYLFIQVGGEIGAAWTIVVVILTAIIGASLLRQQGLSTLMRARQQMDQSQLPAAEMVEGVILVFCGALLLTPGFFTDAVGFVMLIPLFRQTVARKILSRTVVYGANAAHGSAHGQPGQGAPGGQRRTQSEVIDGEFRRDD